MILLARGIAVPCHLTATAEEQPVRMKTTMATVSIAHTPMCVVVANSVMAHVTRACLRVLCRRIALLQDARDEHVHERAKGGGVGLGGDRVVHSEKTLEVHLPRITTR